jgi:hypothetical protein
MHYDIWKLKEPGKKFQMTEKRKLRVCKSGVLLYINI